MHIRQFTLKDTEAVIALWEACGLTRSWNDPAKDIERKLKVQPELFLVGEAEGLVIATAMAGYDGHRGSVYYLAVDPGLKKSGHGKKLMARVETLLRSMGCPKVNVLVRSTNLGVQSFYHKLGYKQDGVVCMGKRLIPDEE